MHPMYYRRYKRILFKQAFGPTLPARLDDTRNVAFVSFFSEANAAETEAAHIATRTSTAIAAIVYPHFELTILFAGYHAFLSHRSFLSLSGQVQQLKQDIPV